MDRSKTFCSFSISVFVIPTCVMGGEKSVCLQTSNVQHKMAALTPEGEQ